MPLRMAYPLCVVLRLSDGRNVLTKMRREHENILLLESLVRRLPDAKLLRNDCTVLNNASIRFMFEVCARDNYSPDSDLL